MHKHDDRDGWHAEYAKGTGRHRFCMDWMCDFPGPHFTYGHSPEIDCGGAFWPLEWRLVVMWSQLFLDSGIHMMATERSVVMTPRLQASPVDASDTE